MNIINVHDINVPSFMNQIFNAVRPFLRKDFEKRIQFHKAGSSTFHEIIPKELLPTEYGGEAGSLAEIREDLRKKLELHREYLIDKNNFLLKNSKSYSNSSKTESTEKIRSKFDDMAFD